MAVKIGCHFVYIMKVSLIHSHPHTGQIITPKIKETLRILSLRHGLPDFMRGNPNQFIFCSFCVYFPVSFLFIFSFLSYICQICKTCIPCIPQGCVPQGCVLFEKKFPSSFLGIKESICMLFIFSSHNCEQFCK